LDSTAVPLLVTFALRSTPHRFLYREVGRPVPKRPPSSSLSSLSSSSSTPNRELYFWSGGVGAAVAGMEDTPNRSLPAGAAGFTTGGSGVASPKRLLDEMFCEVATDGCGTTVGGGTTGAAGTTGVAGWLPNRPTCGLDLSSSSDQSLSLESSSSFAALAAPNSAPLDGARTDACENIGAPREGAAATVAVGFTGDEGTGSATAGGPNKDEPVLAVATGFRVGVGTGSDTLKLPSEVATPPMRESIGWAVVG
jgi:hypothetical protein